MKRRAFETIAPVDYLLRLASSDLGLAYKEMVRDHLELQTGGSVLDLGCGPGADLPAYAKQVGTTGSVIGVDHDESAVGIAQNRTRRHRQVQVTVGDIHSLDQTDHSVDAVHTDRVLQHVLDPATAVTEAARVLVPGGRAVFAEPDWQTLIIDHPEASLASTYTSYVTEVQVRNPRIGRQLGRLAANAGFSVRAVIPVTAVFDNALAADKILGFHRVTQRAIDRRFMTHAEGQRWLDHLNSTESFFASVSLFVVVAVKP